MDNFGEQYCKLCFSTIIDEHFKEMKDITKSIFDVLLKLNLGNCGKYVMCDVCSRKVMEAYRFKSMCVYTNNTIIPYVDETGSSINLKEIYMKETVNKHLIPTFGDYKVCRFCMQLIKDKFIPMHEIAIDMMQMYTPEINLTIVRDPVICKQCFDSFVSHSNFIKNCLEVNERISFADIDVDNSIWKSTVDPCIKTEEIYIKSENEQEGEWLEGMLNKTNHVVIKVEDEYGKSGAAHGTDCLSTDCYNVQGFQYDTYKSSCEYKYISETEVFDCDICEYRTKRKDHYQRHLLTHKYIHEMQAFECDTCGYKSKYKSSLKRHIQSHKDISVTGVFKCEICEYKTKYNKRLKKHQSKHISQTEVFECDTCDFKTKHKKSIKQHQLTHKDASETEIFNCPTCDYKTMRKGNLKIHQLKHKDVSKTEIYQCDACDYKTKLKYYLKQHQLTHKDISEREVFVCDMCSFQTKYKKNIKRHKLIHNVSETEVFACDTCEYKTKRKDHLRDHVLAHKGISEREIFVCYSCDFITNYKNSLKKHLKMHKDIPETELIQCQARGDKFNMHI